MPGLSTFPIDKTGALPAADPAARVLARPAVWKELMIPP